MEITGGVPRRSISANRIRHDSSGHVAVCRNGFTTAAHSRCPPDAFWRTTGDQLALKWHGIELTSTSGDRTSSPSMPASIRRCASTTWSKLERRRREVAEGDPRAPKAERCSSGCPRRLGSSARSGGQPHRLEPSVARERIRLVSQSRSFWAQRGRYQRSGGSGGPKTNHQTPGMALLRGRMSTMRTTAIVSAIPARRTKKNEWLHRSQ